VVDRPGCTNHYRVELKAWIPFHWVVDPESAGIGKYQHSEYEGDGHNGYDGSYRVIAWVEFEWDGYKIKGFKSGEEYGLTRRRALLLSKTAKATCCTKVEQLDDRTFTIEIDSKNPLTFGQSMTPAIDSFLEWTFSGSELIIVKTTTDAFPSHGVRVLREGKPVRTMIVNDASDADPTSRIEIGLRLIDQVDTREIFQDQINICPEGITSQPPVEMYPEMVPP